MEAKANELDSLIHFYEALVPGQANTKVVGIQGWI